MFFIPDLQRYYPHFCRPNLYRETYVISFLVFLPILCINCKIILVKDNKWENRTVFRKFVRKKQRVDNLKHCIVWQLTYFDWCNLGDVVRTIWTTNTHGDTCHHINMISLTDEINYLPWLNWNLRSLRASLIKLIFKKYSVYKYNRYGEFLHVFIFSCIKMKSLC